jgi:hypothetical protein
VESNSQIRICNHKFVNPTPDNSATTKALIPIMKATKADGKNSSVKHRTAPARSQIKVKLGIALSYDSTLT